MGHNWRDHGCRGSRYRNDDGDRPDWDYRRVRVPRLRGSLEKQNVRNSKAAIATLVATARSVAVQRGCAATLHMSADSVWVTACGVNPRRHR